MKRWMVWSLAALFAGAGCTLLVAPKLDGSGGGLVQKLRHQGW